MTDHRNDVPLGDFRVQERVRVRFNEIDGQNIVFNANYLVYADIGVTARISRFGRTNFTLHCGIFRDNERLTDIEISYAHLDTDSGQPTPLPGSFIAEVRRFEARTPTQD